MLGICNTPFIVTIVNLNKIKKYQIIKILSVIFHDLKFRQDIAYLQCFMLGTKKKCE